MLEIEVFDSGPGLPDAAILRLLTSDPVPPGNGTGLRLVRDLVLKMGGSIVQRPQDKGTRIVLAFPDPKANDMAAHQTGTGAAVC